MNAFGKRKSGRLFSLAEDFILLGLTSGIVVSVILCMRFMRESHLPDFKIYSVLDPFLIQLLSLIAVSFFLYHFCKKNGNKSLGLVAGLLCFLLILPVEFLVEKKILKPSFSFARPVCEAEHALIAHALNDKSKYEDISKKINSGDFRCRANQSIFAAMKELYKTEARITQKSIEDYIKDEHKAINADAIKLHFKKVQETWNRRIYLQSIPAYIHILRHAKDYAEEPWLTRMIMGRPTEMEVLQEQSCPSGFALRQVLILLTSIFLMLQKRSSRGDLVIKPAFEKRINGALFLFTNIVVFLYVVMARVAGYRHTFYDIGVGILAGSFIFFFALTILFRATKSKLAIVFLFSIPFFMLLSFYSQHAGNVFYVFLAVWAIILIYYALCLGLKSRIDESELR